MLSEYRNGIGGFLRRRDIRAEAASGANICNGLEDPSLLAFTLVIHDKSENPLFGNETSQTTIARNLKSDWRGDYADDTHSTREYAREITKVARRNPRAPEAAKFCYGNISAFVKDFCTICEDYPYFFQKVQGLQEAYKKYMDVRLPSVAGDDSKITIDCLESADLRMHSIFDCYLNGVYDFKWRRQMIPDNLLEFDIDIVVHDARRLLTPESSAPDARHAISDHGISLVIFRFHDCKFILEGLDTVFSSVSNTELSPAGFQFAFSYGSVEVFTDSVARYCSSSLLIGNPNDDEKLSTLMSDKRNGEIGMVRATLEKDPQGDYELDRHAGELKYAWENVHTGSVERSLGMLAGLLSTVTGIPRPGLSIPGSPSSLKAQASAGMLGKENVYDEKELLPGQSRRFIEGNILETSAYLIGQKAKDRRGEDSIYRRK